MIYKLTWLEEIIHGVPEGQRHNSAVCLVGRWYGKGLCSTEVILALISWNGLNKPPLSKYELKLIIKSTLNWELPR